MEFADLEKALLKFCKMMCKQIISELELGLIFPHVRYVITFDKEPDTKTHCNRAVRVTLRGCKPKDTHFYTFVEELQGESMYITFHITLQFISVVMYDCSCCSVFSVANLNLICSAASD